MMNDLLTALDDLDVQIASAIESNTEEVTATNLKLDPRSYYGSMNVSIDGIAVEGSTRTLNYYGGFEYVDDEHVRKYGRWTFYTSASERVREHLYHVLSPDDARQLKGEYGDIRDEEDME